MKDNYKEHVNKLVKPIFDKVLQEIGMDTMSVAHKTIKFLWRPNNYRLLIPYKLINFKGNTTKGITVSNHQTKYSIKNLGEATLMLDTPKKKEAKLTVIYKPSKRFYYNVESNSINDMGEYISNKVNEIETKLLEAANKFQRLVGGQAIISEKIWIRHEDEVHGEDFIDKIPRDLIIHDTYFKKVYEKGIEFKNPAYVKKYISARVIEDIAPEIANEINKLNNRYNQFEERVLPSIENLALNMKTHVSIMKNINKGIKNLNTTNKRINDKLDQKKLKEWF